VSVQGDRRIRRSVLVTLLVAGLAGTAGAGDWPQWGGRNERNFISKERGLPVEFHPGSRGAASTNTTDAAEPALNVLWTAALGSLTYSTPAVAGRRVFLGTNDERLEHPWVGRSGGGVILCFDAETGRRIWQLPVPRLKTRNKQFNFDDMKLGICSSPTIVENRLYIVSSRGEVLALDIAGQADGNDGPFVDEARYIADTAERPDKPGRFDAADAPPPPEPVELSPEDGDIVWRYDFFAELDVWAQDAVDASILALGDRLFVGTSVGVDKSHTFIPSPNAPDLIVLDRHTGRLLATSESPVGTNIFHGEWSSPTLARAGRRELIVWGGGDGACYAFDPKFEPGVGGQPGLLRRVWRFDANPPAYRVRDGKRLPYNKNQEGPSEIIATPVFDGRRIYVGIGQDSRHGDGPGCFSCIDPRGGGDITGSARVWQSLDVRRSFSSAAVAGGFAVIADFSGILRCFDAETGRTWWTHDLDAHVFGSPLVADGRIYIGDEKGYVTVLALSREKKLLASNRLDAAIYTTPVPASGVLYVATSKTLYAFKAERPSQAKALQQP
jgi:outer membrane protein assembly factor BamB